MCKTLHHTRTTFVTMQIVLQLNTKSSNTNKTKNAGVQNTIFSTPA